MVYDELRAAPFFCCLSRKNAAATTTVNQVENFLMFAKHFASSVPKLVFPNMANTWWLQNDEDNDELETNFLFL